MTKLAYHDRNDQPHMVGLPDRTDRCLGYDLGWIVLVVFSGELIKKDWLEKRWFLTLYEMATPLGFIAIEAGWTVPEVGRQPLIIYEIMKTADAVNPIPVIVYSFLILSMYRCLLWSPSFSIVK